MNLGVLIIIPDISVKNHYLLLAPRPWFGMRQSPKQYPFRTLLHLQQIIRANLLL